MKLNYFSDTDSLYIELADQPSVESREVSEGIVLDKSVPHEVEALRESALLLSISWPRGAEHRDQPEASDAPG